MTTPTTPFQQAILDDATLGQLFFDIAHAAELVAVIPKGVGARHAGELAATREALDEACRAFTARELAGLQLRYRFAGEEWWDTLTHTPAGVRLVRISHTRALATGP
jgi:hypothetical protein